MLHLLLIGGGEIGAPRGDGTYRPLETLDIDKFFVQSLGKKNPRILFIPTASEIFDPNRLYEQGIRILYGDKLGCEIDALYLSPDSTPKMMQKKLDWADGIYIGGGDTYYMMNRWRETGLDKLLKKVVLTGKPIAGMSAGAMSWFEKVWVEIEKGEPRILIEGLGLIKNKCIPHWQKYKESFLASQVAKGSPFIAIDNYAALSVSGDKVQVITSMADATAFYGEVTDKGLISRPCTKKDLLGAEPPCPKPKQKER